MCIRDRIVCLLAWAFKDGQSFLTLLEVPDKWALLGGVIGAFITVTVIRSMADLGPARAAMLIVISQPVSYTHLYNGFFCNDF